MLINKGKDFENMPPSRDALYQHTLRSAHQGGNIWSYIYQAVFTEENVELWGYSKSGTKGTPEPLYTTKPVISLSLIHI